ncbi:MAG TPA: hypothetical protein VLL05_11455 [Terriglobales bacterium]|nr:hypothetical protein [Terriglobales bacterium]
MADVTYADQSEIREVVEKFERCEFALADFTHARHLTVACWYLCTLPRPEALERMRSGLQRFIAHHQKQGYHETITRFWIELLCSYLCRCQDGATITSKINGAIELFATKDVLYSYYTRERVMSDAARTAWIEPDLRAITKNNGAEVTEEFFRNLDVLLDVRENF